MTFGQHNIWPTWHLAEVKFIWQDNWQTWNLFDKTAGWEDIWPTGHVADRTFVQQTFEWLKLKILINDKRCQSHKKVWTYPGSTVAEHSAHNSKVNAGNTKGGSITVLLTSSLTGLESAVWQLTISVFYFQNRLIQTSQTGGQWYNDTTPFSIPWSIVRISPQTLGERKGQKSFMRLTLSGLTKDILLKGKA